MSDTPRTDTLKIPSEALLLLGNKGVPAQIVKAILTLGDHARDLERALSAAEAKVDALREALRFLYSEWQRVRGTKFQLVDDALRSKHP